MSQLDFIRLASQISIRFDLSSEFAFLNDLNLFEFFRNAPRLTFSLFWNPFIRVLLSHDDDI